MKRIVVAAWVLTGLVACDDPTRPADPPAMSPAPGAAALQYGRIRIITRTTGLRASYRYEVIVCASRGFICPWEPVLRRPMAPNDTLITPRYGAGSNLEFRVELKNIPARCRVTTANPTPWFPILANRTRDVRFRVECG